MIPINKELDKNRISKILEQVIFKIADFVVGQNQELSYAENKDLGDRI
jgi:hypothetical protein